MFKFYLERHKYNVHNEYEEQKKNHLLYLYKKAVLEQNGFKELVENLPDLSPKYNALKLDENGLEIAEDVSELYPISIDEEKELIRKTAENLDYLRKVNNTFEYCRTRCKISNQKLRNIVLFPKENQMCATDCLNVRFELFNKTRPNSDNSKQFVWLA